MRCKEDEKHLQQRDVIIIIIFILIMIITTSNPSTIHYNHQLSVLQLNPTFPQTKYLFPHTHTYTHTYTHTLTLTAPRRSGGGRLQEHRGLQGDDADCPLVFWPERWVHGNLLLCMWQLFRHDSIFALFQPLSSLFNSSTSLDADSNPLISLSLSHTHTQA